jgi:membrane fusion protein (multidrug efflux system)
VRKPLVVTLAVVIALAAVGAGLWYAGAPQWLGLAGGGGGQGRERPPAPVTVAQARSGEIAVTVQSVGTLEASQSVVVTSEVTGRVEEIAFSEGEMVAEGDLLVRLEAREQRADLSEARARLTESRRSLARARELAEDGYATQARVDELIAQTEAAAAAVERAQAAIGDREITAPFTGLAGLRRIDEGAYISPDQPITTLVQLDPIDLVFDVPATLLPRIDTGLPVRARHGEDGPTFEGTLTAIDSDVQPATRTIALQAGLANADGYLRPGMFLTARLVLETRTDAVIVPEEAILLEGADRYVFVVDEDDTVHRRRVDIGERRPGEAEVLEGVRAGERVVVGGLQVISDGQTVRPQPAGEGEEAGEGQTPAEGPPPQDGDGDAAEPGSGSAAAAAERN